MSVIRNAVPLSLFVISAIANLAVAGTRSNPEVQDPSNDTVDGFTGQPVSGAAIRNLDLVSAWFEANTSTYEIHARVADLTSPGKFREGSTVHLWRVVFDAQGFTFKAEMYRDILGGSVGALDVQGIQESGAPRSDRGTASVEFDAVLDEVVLTVPRQWTVTFDGQSRTFAFVDGTTLTNPFGESFEGRGSLAGSCNFPCVPIDATNRGFPFTFGEDGGGGGNGDRGTDISAKAIDDHTCDFTAWHFVINQLQDASLAPSTINVTWRNGQTEVVPLGRVTGGVGHYETQSNLLSSVTRATTQIYSAWDGQFNLSSGPCLPP